MTKAWATSTPRREVLRLVVGGVLSGLLTTVGFQRAAAACSQNSDCEDSRTCTDNICDNGTCRYPPKPEGTACPEGGNPCTADVCDGAGRCVHLPKADGESCGADRVCSQLHCCPVERPSFCALTGRCIDPQTESCGDAVCAAGTTSCAGQCVNLTRSKANCGSCGHACPGRKVCRRGRCRRRR